MEAVIRPEFRPVTFGVANLYPGPAAELLRDGVGDMEIPKAALKRLKRKLDDLLLMASGKSNYFTAAMRNEIFGATAFTPAGAHFFALWTTTAGTNMSAYVGNTAGEVTGGSYDRVNKTNNTTNFAAITGAAAKVNSNAITWVTATANWNASAVIPQLGVFDANAKTGADNLIVWGDFTTAKAVLNGDTAQINTSAFSYTDA